MSPILVRPVREQLEHDRVIRLLQTKCKRRFDVGINPGKEQNAPVGVGPSAVFPDVLLASTDRGRRLQTVIEVETGESVNHLEALAEWAHFGRLRAAFHLYVPAGMVDVARRLCEDNQVNVAEIWSYHNVGDQVRFNMVHRNRDAVLAPRPAAPRPAAPREPRAAAARPAAKAGTVKKARSPRPAARPAPARARKATSKATKAARPQKRK